jgi:putative DNA primase/helicase
MGQVAADRICEAESIMMLLSTKERARGRWRQILPAIGIAENFLTGRNCPCPMCGGTDRFRFIDRRGQDGDGMWLCNQCQPKARPAIDLVIAYTGKPFPEAARTIDDILGDKPVLAQTTIRPPHDNGAKTTVQFRKQWRRGVGVRRDDVVDRYLRSRGVGMDIYPPCLRTSALDWYLETHPDFLPPPLVLGPMGGSLPYLEFMYRIPAMFAAVTNPAGQHVATHRTFLAEDGSGKANVSAPRKVAGQYGKSPTIRLSPTSPTMGIAEGIETAIAASRLFNIPVWSVICANGIETFEPPPECRNLIVFADHDPHGVSQRAAEKLCARVQIQVEIETPTQPGTDWNDVLLSETAR